METMIIYDEKSKTQIQKSHSEIFDGTPIPLFIYDIPAGTNILFSSHWHDAYEIHLLLDGYADFIVDGQVYHLAPNEALFINSKAIHGHADLCASYGHYIAIKFTDDFLFPDTASYIYNHFFMPLHTNYLTFTKHITGETAYEKQILSILKHIDTLKDSYLTNSLTIQICLLRIFDIMLQEKAFDCCKQNSFNNTLIKSALFYIHENYASPITVQDAAKSVNISTDYFCKIFKKATGSTPKKYIQIFRLQHAVKEMQRNPDYSIADIAFQSGFTEINYFSRAFKEYMGISPSNYRKKLKKSIICSDTPSPQICEVLPGSVSLSPYQYNKTF